MFGELDYVKVLDFGVAKMTMMDPEADSSEEKLTKAGRIFGTPMYMAPEQACAEPITPATDIYALGLLLFEMLTGLPPVTGRNRMDVIHKQIREEVPRLEGASSRARRSGTSSGWRRARSPRRAMATPPRCGSPSTRRSGRCRSCRRRGGPLGPRSRSCRWGSTRAATPAPMPSHEVSPPAERARGGAPS